MGETREYADVENNPEAIKAEIDFYKARRDLLNDALADMMPDMRHAPADPELQALIDKKWHAVQTSHEEAERHLSNLLGMLKGEHAKNFNEWLRLEQQCETLMSEIQKRKKDMTPEEYDTAMEQLADANERRILLSAEVDDEMEKLVA